MPQKSTGPAAAYDEAIMCNATALRKASRRLSQLYDDALAPSGLRGTQFAILAEVAGRGSDPPTMAELAAALVVDRSALGHNLRPLERDGFVALRTSAQDRRRRHVVLTGRGAAKLRAAQPLWQAAQDHFHTTFGHAAADELRTTLLGIANDERLGALTE
jgi:DNA-binding MarR family transcriptional regulator